MSESDSYELPIDGVLDLHAFSPRDVKDLVPHYLGLCREKGIFQVRIIHGKGKGILRERVHSILRREPAVASLARAPGGAGGWGATVVVLVPPAPRSARP